MKILLTGASSGIGKALFEQLYKDHDVIAPTSEQVNLAQVDLSNTILNDHFDILINCAGTGIGGKISFIDHYADDVKTILSVNLLAPILLTQQILKFNPKAKVVNITSTNNNRYWPGDLVYSLSKKSLETFGNLLSVEYPDLHLLEVRVGLTKTNFNNNRYKNNPNRFQDIYQLKHLTADVVAYKICNVLFDDTIKFIEISP